MPTLRDGNVFVVSLDLPGGNPRRERMRGLLAGVPFEFSDGVLFKNVDADLEAWCVRRGMGTPMTATFFQPKPGDLGVLLAFMQVWETIVQRRLPYAFVLEDDVVPNPAGDVTCLDVRVGQGVDFAFLHPFGGFGMYASFVTLEGAEKLVAARERLIALDKPIDLALWNNDIPELRMISTFGTANWLYVQSTPLNDAEHSQRVAINATVSSI